MLVYDGLAAVSAAFVLIRARREPRGKRAAWFWLSAGLCAFLLGDVVYTGWEPLFHSAPSFPNVGDAFYLVTYPLLMAGFIVFIRARTPGRDWASLIDASIIATGVGVVAWVFLMQPYAADPTLSLPMRALLTAYPAMDVALLAVIVRLAIGRGTRPPSFYFLASAIVTLLITDALYGHMMLNGTFVLGGPLDVGWMLLYALIGVAALHPSASQLYEPAEIGDERLTRRRLALLAAASLFAPAVDVFSARELGTPVVAASAGLFLLVVARMAGLLRALEISMAKVAELQRRKGERRFRALVQNATDVVLVIDSKHMISFATQSAKLALGIDPAGRSSDELFSLLHPDDAPLLVSMLEEIGSGSVAHPRTLVVRLTHADGGERHLEILASNLLDDPDVEGIVLNARDVTERTELEQQLRHLAFHDPVTGLANRALFGDRLEQALRRIERSNGTAAVLFCDLDHFKTINDSLGHSVGDQLLGVVAKRLTGAIRPGDSVARLGGDEFAVLLEDLTGDSQAAAEASEIATRLLSEIHAPWKVAGDELAITASIGIALCSGENSVSDLLQRADSAMYEAKRQRRGSWRLYEPKMHAAALERLRLTSDLKRALERDEFFLVYQPIVELPIGNIVGAEALLRWQHPDLGLVPPLDFVDIAEASGSIVPLGAWVLNEACRQGRVWEEANPDRRFTVSVNVSSRQIQQGDFTATVVKALHDSGLSPGRLVLELTESVFLQEPESVRAALMELKGLGVRLAIDDFGTGYSSLSYLQDLPVDIIKVDKSFVDHLGSTESSVVSSIFDLVKDLGAVAIAEGIERSTQVAELDSLGCEMGQGFHFARPMSADALSDKLGNQRLIAV
ncbi:MAG: hypothetical protein QOF16_1766 [Actinomycetota bacterium]|jgi:diguanylate cyclase (GGDEF)-like protein/PAS domain S-box-containing protein|nr:hypothetical protein [Actinomycetota bacterium]